MKAVMLPVQSLSDLEFRSVAQSCRGFDQQPEKTSLHPAQGRV